MAFTQVLAGATLMAFVVSPTGPKPPHGPESLTGVSIQGQTRTVPIPDDIAAQGLSLDPVHTELRQEVSPELDLHNVLNAMRMWLATHREATIDVRIMDPYNSINSGGTYEIHDDEDYWALMQLLAEVETGSLNVSITTSWEFSFVATRTPITVYGTASIGINIAGSQIQELELAIQSTTGAGSMVFRVDEYGHAALYFAAADTAEFVFGDVWQSIFGTEYNHIFDTLPLPGGYPHFVPQAQVELA